MCVLRHSSLSSVPRGYRAFFQSRPPPPSSRRRPGPRETERTQRTPSGFRLSPEGRFFLPHPPTDNPGEGRGPEPFFRGGVNFPPPLRRPRQHEPTEGVGFFFIGLQVFLKVRVGGGRRHVRRARRHLGQVRPRALALARRRCHVARRGKDLGRGLPRDPRRQRHVRASA